MRVNVCYDAVVLGEGLPLLAAGFTLANGGARTLLVDLATQADGSTPPSASGAPPYLEGVDLLKPLRTLGLPLTELSKLKPISPSMQIVLPDARVDLAASEDLLRQEFLREFPQLRSKSVQQWIDLSSRARIAAQAHIRHLPRLSHLPVQGLRQRIQNRNTLSRLKTFYNSEPFTDPFWQVVARAICLMTTNLAPPATLAHSMAQRMITLGRFGSCPSHSLKTVLQQQVHHKGGEVLNRGRLRAVVGQRRLFEELILSDGEFGRIRFRSLLLTTYPHRLQPYLEASNMRLNQRWLRRCNILFDRYLLPITLMRQGLPPGMAKRLLFIRHPEAPLVADNLLQVDCDNTNTDQPLLWVRFIVPHGQRVDSELTKRLLASLGEVIPFLNENQTPPFLPLRLHGFLYETRGQGVEAMWGLSPLTPWKNLQLAGPANLPALGLEGELLSSVKTAQLMLSGGLGREPRGLGLERNSISSFTS